MKIKVNKTYQDIVMDLFKIRSLSAGGRTGTYSPNDDATYDEFSYCILPKDLIWRAKYSTCPDGFDAWYLDVPNVKGHTAVWMAGQMQFCLLHRLGKGSGINKIKEILEEMGITGLELLYRPPIDLPYALRKDGKHICQYNIYTVFNRFVIETGCLYLTYDKDHIKSIVGEEVYNNYEFILSDLELPGACGPIDTDVIGLDEIPEFELDEFIDNLIQSIKTDVESVEQREEGL